MLHLHQIAAVEFAVLARAAGVLTQPRLYVNGGDGGRISSLVYWSKENDDRSWRIVEADFGIEKTAPSNALAVVVHWRVVDMTNDTKPDRKHMLCHEVWEGKIPAEFIKYAKEIEE